MKKSDLKKILKPIVKECILESLIEEGLLSKVISEVVKGSQPVINNIPTQNDNDSEMLEEHQVQAELKRRQQLQEHREKMLAAINSDAYGGVNVFEGTDPLATAGTPGEPSAGRSPLSGVAPGDAGVDISSMMGMTDVWKTLAK